MTISLPHALWQNWFFNEISGAGALLGGLLILGSGYMIFRSRG